MAVVTVVQNVNNITNTQEYQTVLQKVKFDKPININSMSFYFNGPTTYDCAWVIYSTGFDRIYQSFTKPVTAGWNEFKFNSFLNLPAGTYYIGVTTAVAGVGKLTTMQGMSFQSSDISKDVGGTMVTVSPNLYGGNGVSVQSQAMLSMKIDGGMVNTAPTMPGAFTQPTGTTLEIGDDKVIMWGASSDAENNISKYELEALIDGKFWLQIASPVFGQNNSIYKIPTATTLKFRVRALDSQGLASAYRESPLYTVTKPKYYWSKYSVYSDYEVTWTPKGASSNDSGYPSYNLDSYGKFYSVGESVSYSMPYPVGTTFYGYANGHTQIYRYRFTSTTTAEYDDGRTTYVDKRGGLIQSGIIAEEGTYPTDGQQGGYWWVRGSRVNQSIAPPGPFTEPAAGTVFKPSEKFNIVWGASSASNLYLYEIERAYNEDEPFVNMSPVMHPSTSYPYTITTDKTKTKLRFRVRAKNTSGVYSDWIYSEVYVIQHNVIPTILLNTANNFTMSETEGQNEVLVDGSARDTDANDNIIIKMQINDGTIRNIQSALSDGSTPIEFSKKITYSNKRVYDGATPLTNDLAENVDHTLKVWADDGQGGISTVEERKFRVIHNRPPVISGTDEDLGELLEIPSITYQVDDPEKQTAIITERINGQVIRTFDAELGTEYKIEIPIEMWIPLQLEQEHQLTIEAKDTFGAKSTRTYTFTRTEDTIQLELKNSFVTDIAATRILVTPDVYLPIGSTILIEACNNAFDEVPTWEDVTGMAMNKRGFHFTNTEKTAEQWGINIRFTINKGTAHDQVRFNGFGGAFD